MSDIIAIIALFVSIISLIVTFVFNYRDRVNLKAECRYVEYHPDYDRSRLEIKIVNHGRRAALLRLFAGDLRDGGWQGTYLGDKEKGLRLGEHDFYESKFYKEDIEAVSPDSESEYISLWFEDSLGIRHEVKGAADGIRKLSKASI